MEKYTKDGLPIVTSETIKGFVADVGRDTAKLDIYVDDIKKENNLLGEYIREMLNSSAQGDTDIAYSAVFIYMLLKRQVESNKMAESLKS